MRKINLVAAIALMLAGVGVWATSTTQARIDVPAGAQINPLQITPFVHAKLGKDAPGMDAKVIESNAYTEQQMLADADRRHKIWAKGVHEPLTKPEKAEYEELQDRIDAYYRRPEVIAEQNAVLRELGEDDEIIGDPPPRQPMNWEEVRRRSGVARFQGTTPATQVCPGAANHAPHEADQRQNNMGQPL